MPTAQARRGPEPIEAVLLDAFGTLLALPPPGPRLRSGLLSLAGVEVSERDAARAFRAEIEHYLAHHLEGHDEAGLARLRDECAEVVRRSLRLPATLQGAVREAMLGAIRFEAHPDAAPALASLRAHGARLVVASNWDCSLARVLADAGLGDAVDCVVSSAVVGAAKPDRRLFAAALALAGAVPERAAHVGDSVEHDVEGARAAGIAAVLVRRGRGPQPPAGVPTARSLGEVPRLLFEGR